MGITELVNLKKEKMLFFFFFHIVNMPYVANTPLYDFWQDL